MTKEEIIKKVKSEGFNTDFSVADDCLYCSQSETNYLFEMFMQVDEYIFEEDGKERKLRTVKSDKYKTSGFYII